MKLRAVVLLAIVLISVHGESLTSSFDQQETCSADDDSCSKTQTTLDQTTVDQSTQQTPEESAKDEPAKTADRTVDKTAEKSKDKTAEKTKDKSTGGSIEFDKIDSTIKQAFQGDFLSGVVKALITGAGTDTWKSVIGNLEELLTANKDINPLIKGVLFGVLRNAKTADSDKIAKYLKNVYKLVPDGSISPMLSNVMGPALSYLRETTARILKLDEKAQKLDPMVRMSMEAVLDAIKSDDVSEIAANFRNIYNMARPLMKSILKARGLSDEVVDIADRLPEW